MVYDVFFSYAKKDSYRFTKNLVNKFKKSGFIVFFDEDCVLWGHSIKEDIDNALKNCKYAIVVISKGFISRKWTNYELNFLFKNYKSKILPLLYGLSKSQFLDYYPELQDISFMYAKVGVDKLIKNFSKLIITNKTEL